MEPINFVEYRGHQVCAELTDAYLAVQKTKRQAETALDQMKQAKGELLAMPKEITQEWLSNESNQKAVLRLTNFRMAAAQVAAHSAELYADIRRLRDVLVNTSASLIQEFGSQEPEKHSWWLRDIVMLNFTACQRLLEEALTFELELDYFLYPEIANAKKHLESVGNIPQKIAQKSMRHSRWLPEFPPEYGDAAGHLIFGYVQAVRFDGTSASWTPYSLLIGPESEKAVIKAFTEAGWTVEPSFSSRCWQTGRKYFGVRPPQP